MHTMATIRQKKTAQRIVDNFSENKPLNKKDLLVSIGYAETTARKEAKTILESKGVQEELSILGFSIEEADKVIANLLKNGEKEETKIKAAQEIYKRLSAYAPEKSVNLNINRVEDNKLDVLIAQIEDGLDNPEGTA